jgi:uncharacterized membrane protein YhaH (DUF805 family)
LRWFTLEGRAGRREFNLICLPLLLWEVAYIATLEAVAPNGIRGLGWLLAGFVLMMAPYALIIPTLARRLHDLGFSAGWLFVLAFAVKLFRLGVSHIQTEVVRSGLEICGIGALLALLVMLVVRPGQVGENQFGPQPSAAS